MLLPNKWLSDYVHVDLDYHALSELMASVGFEIDEERDLSMGMHGIVMGRLLSIEQHPTVAKYFVCKVDVGGGRTVQTVSAATNLVENAMCPYALPGSRIASGMDVGEAELEGIASQGMMCSLSELGLSPADFPSADEDGIFFYDAPCEIGQCALSLLGLEGGVYDISVTANRPDAHSIIGMAREMCAALEKPFVLSTPVVVGGGGSIHDLLTVQVDAPDICPRYTARAVKNVKIAPSPQWLRERLRACGLRPINNIVDITNYVMLEYGQPLHAFDVRELMGTEDGKAHITVRKAGEDSAFVTLDGQERQLSPDVLMICNAQEPVGVAGIMGGLQSGIKNDTVTVVFESANFNGASIRRSGRALGLRTDAQARYEKCIDPQMTLEAVNRACELCELLGCADVLDGAIDVDHTGYKQRVIPHEHDKINALLDINLSAEEQAALLRRLHFVVEDGMVSVPAFRADVEGMADLAEEVVRLYGMDNVPSVSHRAATSQGRYSEEQQFERKLVGALIGMGFFEAMTTSFSSHKMLDMIRTPSDDMLRNAVVIRNPLGEDTSIMRTTTLPAMLTSLSNNYNARTPVVRLFELGKVYLPSVDQEDLPEEWVIVTLGSYGAGDFYSMKGVVEKVCAVLRVPEPEFSAETANPSYHAGRCANVAVGGVSVGTIGEVHPLALEAFGIEASVVAATIDLALLFAHRLPDPEYLPLPRFPATTRDLALVCDEDLSAASVATVIRETCGVLLEEVRLFDVYHGSGLPEGTKSLAYSLILRDKDSTLTEARVAEVISTTLTALKERLGVILRT